MRFVQSSNLNKDRYVTRSHKMIDKAHFGTIEIFIYSERRENADYRGEKMIVVSAKISYGELKSVWVKAAILRKISLKLCSIFWVFFIATTITYKSYVDLTC